MPGSATSSRAPSGASGTEGAPGNRMQKLSEYQRALIFSIESFKCLWSNISCYAVDQPEGVLPFRATYSFLI